MLFRKKKIIKINGKEIELEPKPLFKKNAQINNQNNINNQIGNNINKNNNQNINVNNSSSQFKNNDLFNQKEDKKEYSEGSTNKNIEATKEYKEEKKEIKIKNKFFFFRKNELIKVKPVQQSPHIVIHQEPVKIETKVEKPRKETSFDKYALQVVAKQKGLIDVLKEQKITPSEFVKKILISAIMFGILIMIILIMLLPNFGFNLLESIILAIVIGFGISIMMYKTSIRAPLKKKIEVSKHAEKDILFAAREIIISLRSGMPLYNAIVSVSQGYGDASIGFRKIVENVQLGMPLEDAIDEAIANSKSTSFRRLMIQASLSIRIGSDVISALQAVISQLSEERIIELRAYGQRLNALAMFYMLFGVILPSMGIAVATILTTFIPIITINVTMLALALIFISFLQLMFLQMVKSGRPTFSM
jgi:flagellar protein FlaJ